MYIKAGIIENLLKSFDSILSSILGICGWIILIIVIASIFYLFYKFYESKESQKRHEDEIAEYKSKLYNKYKNYSKPELKFIYENLVQLEDMHSRFWRGNATDQALKRRMDQMFSDLVLVHKISVDLSKINYDIDYLEEQIF